MNQNTLRGRGEEGWALVTAVSLMAVMLVIGLATLSTVDFNSQQTRQHRELESSLNLAEGVLYAQAFTLARNWPAPTKTAYPARCLSSSATTGQCPNRENLSAANARDPRTAAFNSTDFLADGSWSTRVRDNYGALAGSYSTTAADSALTGSAGTCPAPCSRDFNDDKALWVESRTVVRGEVRRVAALMRLEQIPEGIPRTGITAGALALTNNSAGSYDAVGASAVVRCQPDNGDANGATCTNYSQNNVVNPPPVKGDVGNLMTPDQIERFKERAKVDGTYHLGCPPSLVGAVVFVEYCKASGSDPGPTYAPSGSVCPALPGGMVGGCANTMAKPGLLIVRCGGLRIKDGTFIGVMYFVNGSDQSGTSCNSSGGTVTTGLDRGDPNNPRCPKNAGKDPDKVVLDVQSGGGVWGALAADGGACIQLGSNGHQFDFDPNVFNAVQSYGTVGLVQNTWRELPPGTN